VINYAISVFFLIRLYNSKPQLSVNYKQNDEYDKSNYSVYNMQENQ